MSSANTNMTIVDRVAERIMKQPIGDLISEEDIHDIVKEAIPRVFFQKRTSGSGYHSKELPPLIVEVMEQALRSHFDELMKTWLVENADVVTEYWKSVMDAGVLNYVNKIQDAQVTTHVTKMFESWVGKINEERVNMGLPWIAP